MSAAPRCLFIKPKLIGDTLLLTPTLDAVRAAYPEATIDVLIRSGSEGILDGCRSHNRVFLTASPDSDRDRRSDPWQTVRRIRETRYDWVFECSDTSRGRYAALFARGWRKVFNRQELDNWASFLDRTLWPAAFSDHVHFEWRDHHAIEGSYLLARSVLNLPDRPPPLNYRRVAFDSAAANLRVGPDFTLSPNRLIVHCGTRLASKAWPDDRWIELLRQLGPHFDQIFLSAGPSEPEQLLAQKLKTLAPAKTFSPVGPLPWNQLAALLQRARLFVGVDTAAMHVAAACQCPLVAIWGPASAVVFGPKSASSLVVLEDQIATTPVGAIGHHDETRLASRNRLETVLRAVDRVLAGV